MPSDNRCQDMLDKLIAAFGSKKGDDRYNASVDFNHDGVINVQDFVLYVRKCPHSGVDEATAESLVTSS